MRDFVERAVESAGRPSAAANSQRFLGLEGLIQLVEQDMDRSRSAVDKNADAFCFAGAVVAHGHMVPAGRFETLGRFHADRVVEPPLDEIDLQFAPFERQRIARSVIGYRSSATGSCRHRVRTA